MRSDLYRVKNPVWVRIVNPAPFELLDRAYRYGDRLMIRPGGVFRPLAERYGRCLAAYEPPHPPTNPYDCPPGALLLNTRGDLRLLAEGKLSHEAPQDPEFPRDLSVLPIPPCVIMPGQKAHVPAHRTVRANPPASARPVTSYVPFREQEQVEIVQRVSRYGSIRIGGLLTAIEHREARLKVVYKANPDGHDAQCETGSWFWMPAATFLEMELRWQALATLEADERRLIRHLLESA